MDAKITGENDERVGLYVDDNNGVEHWIEMEFDGDIAYYEQDGYPDESSNRTPEEREHVGQAIRYARYHVYEERGYDVFPWDEDIERIEIVREAIEALSAEEFEEFFGEFYEKVTGSVDAESSDLAGLLASLQQDASAYYIDVFLDKDDRVEYTSEVQPVIVRDGWADELESPQGDRVPDARIELPPMPLPSIEFFQGIVVHQTTCQIRDYYICMGEEPPEEYRVLGFGKFKFAMNYRNKNIYPDYTQIHADIPGYTVGFGLDEYPEIEQQVKTLLSAIGEM